MLAVGGNTYDFFPIGLYVHKYRHRKTFAKYLRLAAAIDDFILLINLIVY